MAIVVEGAEGVGEAKAAPAEGRAPLLALIVLMTSGILSTITLTTVSPNQTLIADHFALQGQGIFSTQSILTMVSVGMAIGGPLAGWVVPRFGLRRTLFAALALYGLVGMTALVIDSVWIFFLMRFVLGLSAVNIDTAMTTILGTKFTGSRRAWLMGIKQGISASGTSLTVLASGAIAQSWGWRAPFWLYSLAFLILALALIAFRSPIAAPPKRAIELKFSVASLWPIYLLTLLISIAHTMPNFQIGFLLKEDGLASTFTVSQVLAASSVVGIMGAFSFGWIYARLHDWTLIAMMVLMGTGYLVIGFVHIVPLEVLGVLVAGFGAGTFIPYMETRVLERVTPEKRAPAIGLLLSSMFLGHFFNPLFAAPIREYLGNHQIFLITGILLGGGAFLISRSSFTSRSRVVPQASH